MNPLTLSEKAEVAVQFPAEDKRTLVEIFPGMCNHPNANEVILQVEYHPRESFIVFYRKTESGRAFFVNYVPENMLVVYFEKS